MNISSQYLTDYHKKVLKKEAKYEEKIKKRIFSQLDIKETKKLKSVMSQFFCTTTLQIELLDYMEELGLIKGYPFLKEVRQIFIDLNNDLYRLAIKSEEADLMRQEWEKKVENIIKSMPKLNGKQIDLLEEFIKNLKNKK